MSEWTTFIQWKGTDLCMDFVCPDCGAVFKMPTDIPLTQVDKLTGDECILTGDPT